MDIGQSVPPGYPEGLACLRQELLSCKILSVPTGKQEKSVFMLFELKSEHVGSKFPKTTYTSYLNMYVHTNVNISRSWVICRPHSPALSMKQVSLLYRKRLTNKENRQPCKGYRAKRGKGHVASILFIKRRLCILLSRKNLALVSSHQRWHVIISKYLSSNAMFLYYLFFLKII
jgi:hypothetical protein